MFYIHSSKHQKSGSTIYLKSSWYITPANKQKAMAELATRVGAALTINNWRDEHTLVRGHGNSTDNDAEMRLFIKSKATPEQIINILKDLSIAPQQPKTLKFASRLFAPLIFLLSGPYNFVRAFLYSTYFPKPSMTLNPEKELLPVDNNPGGSTGKVLGKTRTSAKPYSDAPPEMREALLGKPRMPPSTTTGALPLVGTLLKEGEIEESDTEQEDVSADAPKELEVKQQP